MSTDRDTTRVVRSWLEEGVTALPDRVLDAVLDQVPATPQRRSWWPAWRPNEMNTYAKLIAGAAAVLLVAVAGYQLIPRTSGPGVAGSAPVSTPNPFGGTVQYQLDGGPATTEVDAVAVGASVSGTAVTTFREATHTVQLGCAAQKRGSWVLGGTVEKTTVPGETAGYWSAVIVKDGSPQQIGIWLSGDPSSASDCEAFVASIEPAELGAENFSPVESGSLVPPSGAP
jgi:hypothetical protein